jgi:hypothetical protein
MIEVAETLQRRFNVQADSPEDADYLARLLYREEEVVLDDTDFTGVEFSVIGEIEDDKFVYGME